MRKFIDSIRLNESVNAEVDKTENIEEDEVELTEQADLDRLLDIKHEIKDLNQEAIRIVKNSGNDMAYQRARSYWYAHISMALDDEHQYVGSSTTSIEDTYNELRGGPEDERLSGAADELNRLIDSGVSLDDAVAQVVNDYGVERDELDAYMNQ